MAKTGLAAKLGAYLDYLIAKPDQELTRPAYLGGRKPTDLYIDPYVFPPGSDQQVVDLFCGFRPTVFIPDAAFMALFAQCLEPFHFRRFWIDCWRPVWQNNTPWRSAIVGRPGCGKSLCLAMTARALALEGKRLLEDPANLPDTPLPLVITARLIADTEPPTDEGPTEFLQKLLRRTLKHARVDEETAKYIVNRAEERQTWLMLDGIDEVHPDKLDWVFAAIADWNCRLIVTSQPNAGVLSKRSIGFDNYTLATLFPDQLPEFLNRWFTGLTRPFSAIQLLELLPPFDGIINPLFLTLICHCSQHRQLPDLITAGNLLEDVVSHAIGLPMSGSANASKERAAEWFPTMAEVMWHFLTGDDGLGKVSTEKLIDIIENSKHRPSILNLSSKEAAALTPRQQAKDLIEELRKKGLLIPLDADFETYTVTHRSLAEYLVARGLASAIESKQQITWGHSEWSPGGCQPIDPWDFVDAKASDMKWAEVIVFLAGRLRDPVRLFTLLTNRSKDDIFHHRVAVAGACVRGLDGQQRARQKEALLRIVRDILTTCFVPDIVHPLVYSYHAVHARPLAELSRTFPDETVELALARLSSSDETTRVQTLVWSPVLLLFLPEMSYAIEALARALFRMLVSLRRGKGLFDSSHELALLLIILSSVAKVRAANAVSTALAECLEDDDESVRFTTFQVAHYLGMDEQRDRLLADDELTRFKKRDEELFQNDLRLIPTLPEKFLAQIIDEKTPRQLEALSRMSEVMMSCQPEDIVTAEAAAEMATIFPAIDDAFLDTSGQLSTLRSKEPEIENDAYWKPLLDYVRDGDIDKYRQSLAESSSELHSLANVMSAVRFFYDKATDRIHVVPLKDLCHVPPSQAIQQRIESWAKLPRDASPPELGERVEGGQLDTHVDVPSISERGVGPGSTVRLGGSPKRFLDLDVDLEHHCVSRYVMIKKNCGETVTVNLDKRSLLWRLFRILWERGADGATDANLEHAWQGPNRERPTPHMISADITELNTELKPLQIKVGRKADEKRRLVERLRKHV